MDRRIGWIATLILLALVAVFILYPDIRGSTGFFTLFFKPGVIYSIDSLSVYQSSSTTIGDGTAVCTGVDLTGLTASCDTNLLRGTSYRFEVVISNTDNQDGDAEQFNFQNVYAASDVLGSDATVSNCGCSDDGVDKPGTPSFNGQTVECALPVADPCTVEKNDGSETFYFVITAGSDPATASGDFFIDQTGETGDTSAETTFSYCLISCENDAECDDSNSLTTDACSNPGTCTAACTNTPCAIACSADAGCDDSDALTTDVCNNPGTCAAACTNTACSVDCSVDADCDDSNSLTTDVCNNAGACTASCSNTVCAIACSADADCDDTNSLTSDSCSSPGTCSASCSYASCTPACFINADCSDDIVSTIDTCNNAGECDANCTNVVCVPTCDSDADCDDGVAGSIDTCIHPGKCGAHCLNEYCTPDCSSDADCDDSDSLTTDTCLSAGSCTASCSSQQCTIACSSDADCDDANPITVDECSSPGACDASCVYTELQLSIELATDFNKAVGRGQKIDLNLLVRDPDGNPVEGADLSLEDAAGNTVDLNSVGNGFYVGEYTVPVDLPLGAQGISLFASKAGLSGLETLSLQIEEGRVNAVLMQPSEPKASVGEKLEFKFKLVYDDGSPVENPDANASLNNVSIPLVLDEATGIFTGHYVFSETDLEQAMLVVSASDSLGNASVTSLAFSVQQPLPLLLIALAIALIVAVLLAFYGLKRTHKLSSLLGKSGMISLSKKKKQLLKAIAREKNEITSLEKGIVQHEKELKAVRKEINVERKRQALAMKRLPAESKYAAHKTAVGFGAKVKRLFVKPKVSPKQLQIQARLQKIDEEVAKLRELVQNLESEYCKQNIKEDFFRQKLFDYREKIHLLELERKKIE